MKITVECTCQTPYEFEIEPVDGKMPGSVFCPTCGADGTEYADWVIQETLAKERAAKPKIALRRSAEAGTHAATPPPLPVEHSVPAEEEPSDLPKSCHAHQDQPMEGFCFSCKKPICLKCMKQFGYFCSVYCRGRAEQEGMDIPVYAGQDRLVRTRQYNRLMRLGTFIVFALIALFVTYEWYQLFGKKPSVKFSLPLAGNDKVQRAQFVDDHELLLASKDKISVYDFKKKQDAWSKSLAAYRAPPPPSASPPSVAADETSDAAKQLAQQRLMAAYEDDYMPTIDMRLVGDGIWVTLGGTIVCLDRATGAEKAKVHVEGHVQDMTFGDNAMVIASAKGPYDNVFTRVELPSGAQQTEERSVPPPPPRHFDPDAPMVDDTYIPPEQFHFVAAGSTVAALDVKLVEKKFTTVQTMKAPKAGQFDEGIKVTQTREMAEDVFNEMKMRDTGGVAKVDESRYALTIQRVFGKDVAPWTGEVIGDPALFALKTVDVLVAGKLMTVFSKTNQKLWESKLSYSISPHFKSHAGSWGGVEHEPATASAPCVERAGTLYFFDQGVLTAFDTKSGAARWRMPSVGISRIQFDDDGMLYVTTTSASPESIQYSDQIDFTNKVEPIVVKVDPATGRVLWRVEKIGDQCYLAGKHLFVTRTSVSGLDLITSMSRGGSVPQNFRLFSLNPKNGKQAWEFYRPDRPIAMDFHDNQILLQFKDKIEILKFLSL